MAALQDQEHPDRRRRRHQVRRLLCQGRDQERDRHQRQLAELCDVRRQRLRLPERRLRCDHRRRLPVRRWRTGGIALTTAWGIRGAFNHNWDPYWSTSLFGSYSAVRYDGGANDNLLGAGTTSAKGAYCAAFAASHPGQALSRDAAAPTPATPTSTSRSSASNPLDAGQEPDVLGRSPVVPSRPEDVGLFGVHGDRSEAGRALPVQGSGHRPAPGPRPA